MITIRKAKTEDLKVIQDLNNKLCAKENKEFDPTVNPHFATTESGERYFRKCLESDDRLVLVAEEDKQPVGYLAGGIEEVGNFRNILNMCEVDNMWVDEKYRSQGVGKQMMNAIEKWAKEKGIKRMRVIASSQNEKGIQFYKREGFNEYDLILEKDL